MEAVNSTSTKRKRVKKIAVIEAWCTGCGGAPVCMTYCKKDAIQPTRDKDVYPFKYMTVDNSLCIGCGSCVTAGQMGIRLSGCPWDAITMEPVGEPGEQVRV